jgi:hypothetical protein
VRAEELLAHLLQPLTPERGRTDHLPGELDHLVHERSPLGRDAHAEAHPSFILFGLRGAGPFHGGPQRADRFRACPRYPGSFGVALRHGKHGLGRADAHLARPDRGPQERTAAQLPGQPRHLLRGARVDPESLAGVVADARATEAERAVTDAERAVTDAERVARRVPHHLTAE